MVELILAASATALATGLGAVPVWALGDHAERLRPLLTGVAAGVMAVAAIQGLLLPAFRNGSTLSIVLGSVAGLTFLLVARVWIERPGRGPGKGPSPAAALIFLVLLFHSLPEGFAIGTAYAFDPASLGPFVVLAIAIQNVPEGTSVAIPMAAAGASRRRQFTAAVLTSVPQPIGAVIAYLLVEQINGLLAASFAFAAIAMLALVVLELGPGAVGNRAGWLAGAVPGAAGMFLLGLLLGA